MSEFTEMADILFDVKEKLDDNEYLQLSNLLLKIKNKFDNIKKPNNEIDEDIYINNLNINYYISI
jgi:hypothetical protein